MKIGIIGCGFVGSTAAYAMAIEGTASEIVLIDLNAELAKAHGNRGTFLGYSVSLS